MCIVPAASDSNHAGLRCLNWRLCRTKCTGGILSAGSAEGGVTKCDAQQQGWQHEQDEVVVDEGRPVVHRASLVQNERHA